MKDSNGKGRNKDVQQIVHVDSMVDGVKGDDMED